MEKIKWYQARWFWGAVIGIMIIFPMSVFYNILKNYPLMSLHDRIYEALAYFSLGFITFPVYLLPIKTLPHSYMSYQMTNFYLIFYYLILCFMFYIIFKKAKVKLKYSIILMMVLLFSFFGGLIIAFISHN